MDQFKIGSTEYDHWPMGGQTRPEQLKEMYSKPDFDPSTRFYAFDGDKMVGFLASAIQPKEEDKNEIKAFFESPYVIRGHENAEKQLIEYAISSLQSKGVQKLILRAGPYWGKSQQWAEEYNFEKQSDIVREGIIDLNNFDYSKLQEPKNIIQYNPNIHFDELAEFLADHYNVSIETMRANLQRTRDLKIGDIFKNPWDQELLLVSNLLGIRNDKIAGRSIAFHNKVYGEKSVIIYTLASEKSKEMELDSQLINQTCKDAKSHGYDKLILHTGPWGINQTDDRFQFLGINFEMKLAFYEKEI